MATLLELYNTHGLPFSAKQREDCVYAGEVYTFIGMDSACMLFQKPDGNPNGFSHGVNIWDLYDERAGPTSSQVNLELTPEEYQFLKELAHELNTQDNRMTGMPYYYSVRTTKELLAPPGYDIGRMQFIENEFEGRSFSSYQKAYGAFIEDGLSDLESEQKCDELEEFGTYEVSEYHNVFLTEKGYNEHMALNKHNYPDDATSFVMHAFRNPEMSKLLDILKKIK